jgi:hypothetical protein
MMRYQFGIKSLISFAILGLLLGASARLFVFELVSATPSPDMWFNVAAPIAAILIGFIYSVSKRHQVTVETSS